jgi:hypothetical protein
LRLYVMAHGPESLLPRRKEPITNEQTRAILSVPNGTVLGSFGVDWISALFVAFRALLTLLRQARARKADLIPPSADAFDRPLPSALALAAALPNAFLADADPSTARISRGGGFPTRANIRWYVGATHYAELSAAQLRALRTGDCAVFLPGGSKADFDSTDFGARPAYLPFVDEPINAARGLAQLELSAPVHGAQRAHEPMIPAGTDRRSLCHTLADELFRLLAERALGPAVAATLSLHSGRVWLACALLASNHPPPAIQAFCRWKSAESVKIYARMNPTEYAAALLGVMNAKISNISPHNLPVLDHDERFAALRDDADGVDGDGAARAMLGAATQPELTPAQPRLRHLVHPRHRRRRSRSLPALHTASANALMLARAAFSLRIMPLAAAASSA